MVDVDQHLVFDEKRGIARFSCNCKHVKYRQQSGVHGVTLVCGKFDEILTKHCSTRDHMIGLRECEGFEDGEIEKSYEFGLRY